MLGVNRIFLSFRGASHIHITSGAKRTSIGIMSTSTTRADSIRQAVNSELCELLVKIYIDDWAYARQCELDRKSVV